MKLKTAKYKGTKEWTSFIKAKLSSKLMPRLSLNTFLDDNFSTKLALHEMCAYNQYSESILMKRRLCLQNIPETIINISLKYEYIIFYKHYIFKLYHFEAIPNQGKPVLSGPGCVTSLTNLIILFFKEER